MIVVLGLKSLDVIKGISLILSDAHIISYPWMAGENIIVFEKLDTLIFNVFDSYIPHNESCEHSNIVRTRRLIKAKFLLRGVYDILYMLTGTNVVIEPTDYNPIRVHCCINITA